MIMAFHMHWTRRAPDLPGPTMMNSVTALTEDRWNALGSAEPMIRVKKAGWAMLSHAEPCWANDLEMGETSKLCAFQGPKQYQTVPGWWFGTWLLCSNILGMSSSQFTFIFPRGVAQPPIRSNFVTNFCATKFQALQDQILGKWVTSCDGYFFGSRDRLPSPPQAEDRSCGGPLARTVDGRSWRGCFRTAILWIQLAICTSSL